MRIRSLKGILVRTGLCSQNCFESTSHRKDALVKEIMVSECYNGIKPSDNLDYCMELMNTKKIRHLPVMDNNDNMVGIISISDVVKAIIEIAKRHHSTI